MTNTLATFFKMTSFSLATGKLIQELVPLSAPRPYRKGSRLSLRKGENVLCRIIISGSVKIYRNADNLLVAILPAPNIIGLSQFDADIVTTEPSQIGSLTLSEALQAISEKNLWSALVMHRMIISHKLYIYSKQLSTPTAYEAIRNQLIALSNEPLNVRREISVEHYIRNRIHLSRSSIMKILANLRAGGYITIENGRLIEIRHLPSKY